MNKNQYFDALGIDPKEIEKEIERGADTKSGQLNRLREAYDKAHEIRQFEIGMYWQRSSYFWAIQAVALGGVALILSNLDITGGQCDGSILRNTALSEAEAKCIAAKVKLLVIAAIWLFGAFSAYIWMLLLKGAKFWQNNWERHVDELEDTFSGSLYKVYLIKSNDDSNKGPYSVSKLNQAMATFTFLLWMALGAATDLLIFGVTWTTFFTAGILLAPFAVALLFDNKLRMEDFGSEYSRQRSADSRSYKVLKRFTPEIPTQDTLK